MPETRKVYGVTINRRFWILSGVKDGHAHFFNHKGHTKVLPVGELPPIERKEIIAWKVQYTAAERLPNELKIGQLDLL